jgi:hypothetical protein
MKHVYSFSDCYSLNLHLYFGYRLLPTRTGYNGGPSQAAMMTTKIFIEISKWTKMRSLPSSRSRVHFNSDSGKMEVRAAANFLHYLNDNGFKVSSYQVSRGHRFRPDYSRLSPRRCRMTAIVPARPATYRGAGSIAYSVCSLAWRAGTIAVFVSWAGSAG